MRLDARTWASRLRRGLGMPCAIVLLVVAINLGVREFLPFSRFPMYALPSSVTHYFVVTDDRDRPLASQRELGVRGSRLRKAHQNVMRRNLKREGEIEAEALAAAATLDLALDERMEAIGTYRLWRVELSLVAGKIVRERRLVAEARRP
jgi:hypothetical protein